MSHSNLRYFIVQVYTTSAGAAPAWVCRIVDNNYMEIFNEFFVEKEEVEIFKQIMDSDKGALLHRTHPNEVLQKICNWKIDNQQRNTIKDGTKYP